MKVRPWQARTIALAAVLTAGCEKGNTLDGHFSVRGTQQERFDVVDPKTLGLTTLRVEEAPVVAVGGLLDVSVSHAEFWTRPPAEIVSAALNDPSIATLDVLGESSLRFRGVEAGDGVLTIEGPAERDTMQVFVREPQELAIAPGCSGSWEYWSGMPAVVRYELHSEDGKRVFGRDLYPFRTGAGLVHRPGDSTAWDWVFDITGDTELVELHGTLNRRHGDGPKTETLGVHEPPRIGGVRFVSVVTGAVVNALTMTPDNEVLIRAVPVAEDGKIMCNTFVRGRFTSSNPKTCLIKSSRQADFTANSSPETAHLSVRSVSAGGCGLKFTPMLDRLDVIGDAAELAAELSVGVVWASSFASGQGGSGGGGISDD